MPHAITPFLMFEGRAEEAIRAYVGLFADSQVLDIQRYGPGEPGAEGSVRLAAFRLAGREVRAIDSPMKHGFTFTPSFSFFVDCVDEAEFERAFAALSEGGGVLMPPGDYGFSRRFAWVNDRFGVSWQLNLP
jgi:predicted 3-demethylubiquinone-9 3-methyltransferase (glyoxalase superfamily)